MKTAVAGYPRIGTLRELKFALEKYFRKEISADELTQTAKELRKTHWLIQKEAGIDYITSNDFSYYDIVLDTAFLLNIIPERYKELEVSELDKYLAMARGYQGENGDVKALAMKKWFNTNYHYIVPEAEDSTQIRLTGNKLWAEYAEAKGWRTEVIEMEDSEAGGFSLVSFKVNGEGAYGTLKFESGSHRVQRVPKTESQGRIHTSTATVLCMPEVEAEDFDIDMNDLEIETMRSSGAGGQHINKTDSAVRIVHKPTGIVVKCQDGRSQHENRATALMTIRARVYEERQRELDQKNEKERRTKIGTGDRAEKIRTYNYPQNRVTDHRIGYTVNQLDRIMDGRLDDLMAALQLADQQAKIAGEKE